MNYNSITEYYSRVFGGRVYKLALDIGGTCPNRDGKVGRGGCIFCSGSGSGDYATIYSQLSAAKQKLGDKQCGRYIAYLQSYSNTYMPVCKLDECIEQVLRDEEICGISIATRPDCIEDDMLQYLSELNGRTHLVVELGLQSASDKTLQLINRGHNFEQFLQCYQRLSAADIKVCVHIMDGLPGENAEDMLATARAVAALQPHSVKVHCVYVQRGTVLAEMYERREYKPLEMQQYIEILAEQLRIFGEDIYIERVTGDGDRRNLIAPKWTLNKRYFLNRLNEYLAAAKRTRQI